LRAANGTLNVGMHFPSNLGHPALNLGDFSRISAIHAGHYRSRLVGGELLIPANPARYAPTSGDSLLAIAMPSGTHADTPQAAGRILGSKKWVENNFPD
jgi:hypothetical protein